MLKRRRFAGGRRGLSAIVAGVAVLVLAAAAAAQDKGPQPAGLSPVKPKPINYTPRTVTLQCADGVKLAADYFPPLVKPEEKAPSAILIHMYPADRASWKPLIPELRQAGFAVLAYDIRGHAGSADQGERNLKEQYDQRDPALFASAAMDTDTAVNFLSSEPGCDPQRVVLIGASIGCSIAMDYAPRTPVVKAIVCLSPGTNYMELNSLEHIKFCADRAVLLIAPEGEYKAVEQLIEASGKKAVGKKHPGGVEQHGTKLFSAPYGKKVIKEIRDFVAKAAGATGATVSDNQAKGKAKATSKPKEGPKTKEREGDEESEQDAAQSGEKKGQAKSADKKPPPDGDKKKKSSAHGAGRRGVKIDGAGPDGAGKGGDKPAKKKPAKPVKPSKSMNP